ncbi:hypothetical protein BSKO_04479 [Bryopsis sp. KO-2023]|nr:hypothetical protein BSKO_04479 [Bryopsis sp. KO-2023]
MAAVDESTALVHLLFQYVALDEGELARLTFLHLQKVNKSFALEALIAIPETPPAESEAGADVSEDFSGGSEKNWARIRWSLATSLEDVTGEEGNGNRMVHLKALLGVLMLQLGKEENWELGFYPEGGAGDGPESLGGRLTDSEVGWIQKGVEKLLAGKKPGKLKGRLNRAAKLKTVVLWGIAQAIREGQGASQSVGCTQFLDGCDSAFLEAVEECLQSGSVREAVKTLQYIQGNQLEENKYKNVLQRAVKYTPASLQGDLLQAVLASGNPWQLSIALQELLDVALLHRSSEGGKDLEEQGSGEMSDWKSFGFQKAKVMQWHVGGKRLQRMAKECEKGDVSSVIEALGSGNKLEGCLAILVAWDAMGSEKPGQVLRSRKALMDTLGQDIVAGGELSGAIGLLKASIKFASVLGARQGGKDSDTKAGKLLLALNENSPLELMHKTAVDMDSELVKTMMGCVAHLPPNLQYPLVRDVQLVTASGVILSMVGMLTICSNLLDGRGELADQSKWLNETQSLVNNMEVCLSGLKGSYVHAWLLSVLSSIFRLVGAKPEEAGGVELQFMLGEAKKGALGQKNNSIDVLKILSSAVNVLSASADSISVASNLDGDESWEASASAVHLQFVKESLAGVKAGLAALIKIAISHPTLMSLQGSWKDVGSFLLLGEQAFELLNRQEATLCKPVAKLKSSIDKKIGEAKTESEIIENLGHLVDVCLSQKADRAVSSEVLEMVLKLGESISGQGPPIDSFEMQSLFTVVRRVKKVMEGAKGQLAVSDVLGACEAQQFEDGWRTPLKSVARVRRQTEHLKALARLRDAVRAANRGRLQYLSGLLHNLSRALTDDNSLSDLRCALEVAGFGPNLELAVEATPRRSKAMFEEALPLTPKATKPGYLSDMVNYLAGVGDVISTWDDGPSEGHNYFAMLGQSPQELLSILVGKSRTREHIEAAAKVANVLQVDLVREIRKTWLFPITAQSSLHSTHHHADTEDSESAVSGRGKSMPSLEAVHALAGLAPVRVLLTCAVYSIQRDLLEVRDVEGCKKLAKVAGLERGEAIALFTIEKTAQYPTLRTWLETEVGKKSAGAVAEALKSQMKGQKDGLMHQVQDLLSDAKYREAMEFAEKAYEGDIPDDVLAMIVSSFPKDGAEQVPVSESENGTNLDPLHLMPISLVACLKVKDRARAIELADQRFLCLPLDNALHFYSLTKGQLEAENSDSKMLANISEKVARLQLYKRVLRSPLGIDFKSWVEVDSLFERDPGQLVRRLIATDGAVAEAISVVDLRPVPATLKIAARATYTQELANGCAARGAGPAAALRYLKTFPENDAFEVGIKVLTSAPSLRLCRLLVQFLMSLKERLPPKSIDQLKQLELGLAALRCLPDAWSDRCAHLVETPSLILESLIMAQQTVAIRKLLQVVPALQDDNLLIFYARKALGLGPDTEALPAFLGESVESASSTSSFGLQPDMRQGSRSFLRFPSDSGHGGAGMVTLKVLSGLPTTDEVQRLKHTFRGQPNLALFRVLMDLCSAAEVSSDAADRAATDLANELLANPYTEFEWNPVVSQKSQDAVDVCLDVLQYSEKKMPNRPSTARASPTGGALPSVEETPEAHNEDPPHEIPRTSSAFASGPKLAEKDSSDEGKNLKTELELLQRILAAGMRASLSDMRDAVLCDSLLNELVTAEHYSLAVCTARHCDMDERPFWEAWVGALVQEGNFEGAREKVAHVFKLPGGVQREDSRAKAESRQAAMRLVRVLETTCPVDSEAFRRLQASLKKARWGFLRMSASNLVNVLRGQAQKPPPKARRWWRSVTPKKTPPQNRPGASLGENLKRKVLAVAATSSTLLAERMKFAEELLAAHAPAMLIPFMFKHGRGEAACRVMFPVGMEDEAVAAPSIASGSGSGRFRGSFRSGSFSRSGTFKTGDPGSRSGVRRSSASLRESRSNSVSDNASDSGSADTGPPRATQPGSTKISGQLSGHTSVQSVQGSMVSQSTSGNVSAIQSEDGNTDVTTSAAAPNDVIIAGVEPRGLSREVENIGQICDLSVRYDKTGAMISAMIDGGSRGRRCLNESCTWLESNNRLSILYRCQRALEKFDIAGLTCLKLSWRSTDGKTALHFLESARGHFQEALSSFQKSRSSGSSSGLPPREKGTLPQAALAQYIARCKLQSDVYQTLVIDGDSGTLPRECCLFAEGPEETEQDEARRMKIVVDLIRSNFNLAFRVLFEFRINHTQAYATAVSSMAKTRHHQAIRDLIHNIKGTVTDSELDKILAAAVEAYTSTEVANAGDDAHWTVWFAEGFIELMVSPHARVLACLQLGDVDRAFRIANERGGYEDLNMVSEAAEQLGDKATVKKCERILGRARVSSSE